MHRDPVAESSGPSCNRRRGYDHDGGLAFVRSKAFRIGTQRLATHEGDEDSEAWCDTCSLHAIHGIVRVARCARGGSVSFRFQKPKTGL